MQIRLTLMMIALAAATYHCDKDDNKSTKTCDLKFVPAVSLTLTGFATTEMDQLTVQVSTDSGSVVNLELENNTSSVTFAQGYQGTGHITLVGKYAEQKILEEHLVIQDDGSGCHPITQALNFDCKRNASTQLWECSK